MTPAAPPSPTPAAPPQRRPWRLLAWGLALLVALLLAATAALAWLGSASGLQWLAARTPLQIGGTQITLRGVSGNAWGQLRLDTVDIVTPTRRITLRHTLLRWTPAALWQQRTVHIRALEVGSLHLTQTHPEPASGPLQPPASLRLPLPLVVEHFALDDLRAGPPGALQAFGRFDGRIAQTQGRWAVQMQAHTPWAQARLDATLGDTAPFPLQATLAATQLGPADQPVADSAAQLRASGTLTDLQLAGTLHMRAASAAVQARLAPFDPTPLRSASLRSTGLDPAAFNPALPQAALDVQLVLGPSSAARLQGSLQLRNTQPGPLDQRRLPLRALQATLAGDAQHATASDLHIDLGAGGTLQGTLTWAAPQLQARLQADGLNARALQGALAATRLSGTLALDASAQQQTARIALAQPGWDIHLDAQRNGDNLRLQRLVLAALGGRLDASGTLSTQGAQPFTLRARLRQFNPAQFGAYPAATLNADLDAQGEVQQRRARLNLSVQPSLWRGHTFSGHAQVVLDPQRLQSVDAVLALGDNRLQAQGAFGLHTDTLRFNLDAPALAQLDAALQGSAQAQGELHGGLQAPSGTLTAQADGVRWDGRLALQRLRAASSFHTGGSAAPHPAALQAPALNALLDTLRGNLSLDLDGLQWTQAAGPLRIGVLHAQAQASAGLLGTLHLDARVQDVQAEGQVLQTASLQVDGTRAQHTLALDAQGTLRRPSAPEPGAPAAQPLPLNLKLRAAGGWMGPQQGWQGQVTTLDNSGRAALHLQAPAALDLAFNPLRLQLRHATLALQAGRIDLERLHYTPEQLQTQGRLQALQTADLLALAGIAPAKVRDTLVLSGDWAIDAGAQVNGHVHLQRDSGDIALQLAAAPAAPAGTVTLGPTCDASFGQTRPRGGFMPLGLGQVVLDLTASNNQVQAQAVLQTAMGTAQGSGSTTLTRRGAVWGVSGQTPLQLDLGADMPSLAWAAPLIGYDYRAQGRLRLAVQGRGTLAQPQFSGTLDGTALRLAWPAEGVDLKDGVLRAHFTGDHLQLDQFELHGPSGVLSASGDARLRNGLPNATLAVKLDKLLLLNRPDRQLALSGTAQATLADKVLAVTTALTADRADIALPRSSGPALSSDVVIKGQPAAPPPAAAGDAMPRAVRFDGSFDLGSNFHLYGQGLDAMLSGSVRVRADNGSPPSATGSI